MMIIYKDTFVERLKQQLKYLFKNSPKSARKFLRIRIYFENQLTLKTSWSEI